MSDDLAIELRDDHVAVVEFSRPPYNYFDTALIRSLADAYAALDADPACRAIVLCSTGKHFCAGADFAGPGIGDPRELYAEAARLFEVGTPTVATVHGAAIGGGLGLALSADFRVATRETRFIANFARLGIHHGFGLTVTLPAVIGAQKSLDLLTTGRAVDGAEAETIGLCDRLTTASTLRDEAIALAAQLAANAPLAVRSIRTTLRGDLAEKVCAATDHEAEQQAELMHSADFAEGVRAVVERRAPKFTAS
ncbi:enoyl-CoA hydratase/isomerase family protein [Nocardia sp. NBC_00403]|uniref:enoyl-CoA hydratase/isomerase family protein n=1 Tax=Nocardia sp. NBC_00403 TaxID=2975990 RepID=UPI002E1C0419